MRKAGARFKSKKGISLVELVITIALLSIFAAASKEFHPEENAKTSCTVIVVLWILISVVDILISSEWKFCKSRTVILLIFSAPFCNFNI